MNPFNILEFLDDAKIKQKMRQLKKTSKFSVRRFSTRIRRYGDRLDRPMEWSCFLELGDADRKANVEAQNHRTLEAAQKMTLND